MSKENIPTLQLSLGFLPQDTIDNLLVWMSGVKKSIEDLTNNYVLHHLELLRIEYNMTEGLVMTFQINEVIKQLTFKQRK